MSLVDYAASSDEDDEPQNPTHRLEDEQLKKNPEIEVPAPAPSSNDASIRSNTRTSANLGPPSTKKAEKVSNQSSELKLPDASFLLNSPVLPSNLSNVSDHSSRVAAAMAESAARKRELIEPTANAPRSKLPKGALPHSKGVPDTVGSHLLPPQLAGRSNIVTEDISKLFVRKNTKSSTE
ncbi:glutamate receptor 2.6 [Striga asiatica]|uniref:Glutamate receptor 2.6 n=1 Tax=Striga asiatica TaxID=4170 RepID=A0A5A7QJW7_STRAF|nr:glutamate receptor 2.6 [Striga asiatica]